MSRRNIFQYWYLNIYLRLTHTILCLEYIHYIILEQFDNLGYEITFISETINGKCHAITLQRDCMLLHEIRNLKKVILAKFYI